MNLDELLRERTRSEQFYLDYPGTLSHAYQSMKTVLIKQKQVYLFELPTLSEKEVLIRRDSRFTPVPDHIHSNVNINYIYSGQSTYVINDKEVKLFKGDVCILDRNVVRSKEMKGEDDIVINISIDYGYLKKVLLKEIGKENIMINFFINAIAQTSDHDNYLIFRTNNMPKINQLFQALLLEYYQDMSYRKDAMFSYLLLVLFELLRLNDSQSDKQLIQLSDQTNKDFVAILQYIDSHYKDCTLNELAETFSYHPKYLSSLIKQTTNKTFKRIQNRKRIIESARLLRSTNLSVEEVARAVGYSNVSSFYKYFFSVYGYTPKNYRRSEQGKNSIALF